MKPKLITAASALLLAVLAGPVARADLIRSNSIAADEQITAASMSYSSVPARQEFLQSFLPLGSGEQIAWEAPWEVQFAHAGAFWNSHGGKHPGLGGGTPRWNFPKVNHVPDGGTTALMLGAGLVALGLMRNRNHLLPV